MTARRIGDFPQVMPHQPDADHPGLTVEMKGYILSDEVRNVAEALIGRHPRLEFIGLHEVGYLLHHAKPRSTGKGHEWAHVKLVSKELQPVCSVEAVMTVNAMVWEVLSEKQRDALVLHELCHLEEKESGGLATTGHDIEEFGFVVAQYGQWRTGLERFAEQMALGLKAGKT